MQRRIGAWTSKGIALDGTGWQRQSKVVQSFGLQRNINEQQRNSRVHQGTSMKCEGKAENRNAMEKL